MISTGNHNWNCNAMNQNEIDSCGFGLLVDLTNHKSSILIKKALLGLSRLQHRGAVGEDGLSGDGCGLMIQLDQTYFAHLARQQGISITPPFAIGMCFLNPQNKQHNQSLLTHYLTALGFSIAGWREVPTDLYYAGKIDTHKIPAVAQLFIKFPVEWPTALVEKKLFIAKQLTLHALREDALFSMCSVSSQTIIYKALVLPINLPLFYPDLQSDALCSSVALFHQRFSTNTLPSWHLTQPFSTLAHNGEINTIQGNRHYAQQLSHQLIADYFPELQCIDNLINVKGSDSLSLDNLLESLRHAGMSSYEALRLMIPPAWENDLLMPVAEKDYYRFHALHMPPWEGPAGIVFYDGRYAGCILDRNGFRPARTVKKDNWFGVGSEIGLFDLEEDATELSRLKPGELLLIDLENKQVIDSKVHTFELAQNNPYGDWVQHATQEINALGLEDESGSLEVVDSTTCKRFDVSFEEKEQVLRYIAQQGVEPTSSMGDDTPMAALSLQPRQLFDFFRQQFAQVTNPPVDSLRETSVLSLNTYLGTRGLIANRAAHFAHFIQLNSPLLTQLHKKQLEQLDTTYFHRLQLSLAYDNALTIKQALDDLLTQVPNLSTHMHYLIILSDEVYTQEQQVMHPALAVGALHQALINLHVRQRVSIIVHSAWIREAHHVAMTVASGADAVYPWLAYQLIGELARQNKLDVNGALKHFYQAVNKGLLKIASKMGVCTINSYKGAQLFHLIGLHREIIQYCFTQCAYWLESLDWHRLDVQLRIFYQLSQDHTKNARIGGLYKYTPQGEYHDYNPEVVNSLLRAVSTGDARFYQQFKELLNYRPPVMIRDFLQINSSFAPIHLDQVEKTESILKRFDTAAMSLGSLGPEAHEALAIAMNTLGGRSNSGEGGETIERNGTLKQSKIKQVASGRFGVTAEYLMHAEVIQIKIAQGAKPGEGGQLAGNKVTPMIAHLRYSTPGTTLISPPPHHDIYSIEDLAQLIFDLKQVNPKALISVKLVAAPGIGTIAAGVVKAYADMITISGYDGGTGASPLSSIRNTGCPWELGLNEIQNVLLKNKLRHRVTLQVDGGLKTGLDVVKAALLGAESFGFGTAPLVTLGCKYLRICHLNNCATGIATQDERLRDQLYQGQPERVMLYFKWVAEEVREHLSVMGFKSLQEIIGRVDLLQVLESKDHSNLESMLLQEPIDSLYQKKLYKQCPNPSFDKAYLAKSIRNELLPCIRHQKSCQKLFLISNKQRSIGANVAGEIAKRYGNKGFKARIDLHFKGIAGQSFGAWLVQGLYLQLDGAANDYVAKGMAGGEIIVKPFAGSLNPQLTTLAGNTCLYGATGGQCFIDGLAGVRFAVRNSGAEAVVLGISDHGCEYMTGGTVVILSTPGHNFAAGMTGGIAFVYDNEKQLVNRCNTESVRLYSLEDTRLEEYQQLLHDFLVDFKQKTQSVAIESIIQTYEQDKSLFYLIFPLPHSPFKEGA